MTSSSHSDDCGLTISAASTLESISHDSYIARAIECEVNAPLLTLSEPLTCRTSHWIMTLRCAKLLCYFKLAFVDVEAIDSVCATVLCSLDDSQTDGSETPDCH